MIYECLVVLFESKYVELKVQILVAEFREYSSIFVGLGVGCVRSSGQLGSQSLEA